MGTKHTPGPWTVHEDPENPGFCTIYPEHGHPIGEEGAYFAPADARLIAASPDLLEALDAVMNSWRVVCSGQGWDPLDLQEHRAAVAAIAKARGTT